MNVKRSIPLLLLLSAGLLTRVDAQTLVTANVSWHGVLIATVETRISLTTITCGRVLIVNRAANNLPINDIYVRADSGVAAIRADSTHVVLATLERTFNTGNFNTGNLVVSLISAGNPPASVECLP
jgi:hypothetical protein